MSLQETVTLWLPRIPGYRRWHPRRMQTYAVGCPKTGTHSLAAMFSDRFRAIHEAEPEAHVDLLARSRSGQLTDGQVRQALFERDRRLWLEFDASHVNGEFVGHLGEVLPRARFVLTVREPLAWVDSAINQHLGRPSKPHWAILRDLMYGPRPETYPAEERKLQDAGVFPLGNYVRAWARRYQSVVAAIPPERRLVLRTGEIESRLPELADFCGVPLSDLHPDKAHQFPARQRFGLMGQLDPGYVRAVLLQEAADVVTTLFPGATAPEANP
jgi:hypothetical protein